jgi:hypothetical protein
MSPQECDSISYAKTHSASLKIIDCSQHPRAISKVGNVNFSPNEGNFHMKSLPNKVVVDTHDVTSPMKARGEEVANSNQRREKGEPCAKLLNAIRFC